jgi:hypothetical protein
MFNLNLLNSISTIKNNILSIVNKTAYSQNAIGLYLSDKSTWTNPAFDFIVGDVGDVLKGANPQFKYIVENAYKKNLPLIAVYKVDLDAYTNCPFNREDLLPSLIKDEMYQTLIKELRFKTFAALVININDPLGHDGKPVDPNWIDYTTRMFIKRVQAWLKIYKPNAKLLIGVSDTLIKENAPAIARWISDFDVLIPQHVKTSDLVNSFPPDKEKPRYYGKTWKFWKYSDSSNLVLFNGNETALRSYLGLGVVEKPEEPEDPKPEPVTEYVSKVEFDALKSEFNALKTAYWAHTHPIVRGSKEDSFVVGKPK